MAKMKGASLEQSIPSPSQPDKDYETENHLRTLNDAADIMSNPTKLKKVHKMAGRRHKALTGMIEPAMKQSKGIKSIDDLKAVRDGKAKDDDGDF